MRKNLIKFSDKTVADSSPARRTFKVKFSRQQVRNGFKKIRPRNVLISVGSLAAVAALVVGVVVAMQPKPPVIDYRFTEDSVGMQMFGYNWNSLKSECTDYLGPNGVDWILVDPPSDHIRGTQWWIHYQPTNYDIIGDHGTRAEFEAMVSACKTAGVSVLADVVFNHMAGGWFVSFGGKAYGKDLKFDDLYTKANFHQGLDQNNPHYCNTDIVNWNELWERTNCRFPGLPDLATEQEHVREKVAGYLMDLQSLGVAGFRFDAAKHVDPKDIAAILNKLETPAFVIQEVPGDATISAEYQGNGHVWAWSTADDLASAFAYASKADTEMVGLSEYWAESWPSALSVTWVNNHDTERDGGSLSYKDPDAYRLAQLYLLAQPFGQPMLYSGYRFTKRDEGAPQDAEGRLLDVVCGEEYLQFNCTARRTDIAGMIAFKDAVAGTEITGETGQNGIYQMQRDGKGFFALNYNKLDREQPTIATGMAAGKYCNLVETGRDLTGDSCIGLTIEIDASGNLLTKLAKLSAIAITEGSKLN